MSQGNRDIQMRDLPEIQQAFFTADSKPGRVRRDVCEDRRKQTRSSMLWAAYADALGFISELVDKKGLKRRTKGVTLDRLMSWKRRIGGRGGVEAELPVGCWSDDTQLRMAVCRAIGRYGFDIDSFSRIELPVWPAYALGAGLASKAAAANLAKRGTPWYANTFRGWTEAGGNGAAMRIQPHVWASTDLETDYMVDVITDSVCTHGHPRAIVGACFHASTLAYCLKFGTVPDLRHCKEMISKISDAFQLIEDHAILGSTWISLWEQEVDKKFKTVWKTTIDELDDAIKRVATSNNGPEDTVIAYERICGKLGLGIKDQRGSGLLTSVAAISLAGIAQNAYEGAVVAANALGTDTDTIGTMVGALLGACNISSQPPQDILDSEYLACEADRLTAISEGKSVHDHSYPDILTWTAPRTQADSLVNDNGHLVVDGLGRVVKLQEEPLCASSKTFAWQWVRTDFGQTLLIKHRLKLRSLDTRNNMNLPPAPSDISYSRQVAQSKDQVFDEHELPIDRGVDLDAAINHARKNIAENDQLGYVVRRVARDGSLTELVDLVSKLREDLRR